jgi:cytochrome bd-type quinol oxidase subunit 2
MTTSKMIAALMGPTLAAISAAMLLNLGSLPALTEELSREPMLILVSGVLLFVAGLAIVRVHNRWAAGWPVLVTVLGWLAVAGGVVRMLFPIQLASIVTLVGRNASAVSAALVVLLAVGAFLSYKGYSRE